MEFKDYYGVLRVQHTADKTIKTFSKTCRRFIIQMLVKHTYDGEKVKEAEEAYEDLHYSEKRADYDELRLSDHVSLRT